MNELSADTLALMGWVNHESGDADLVGFFVRPDSEKPKESVLANCAKAELVAALNFFHRFIMPSETLGVHQGCFLRVGERQDRVHLARDL